MSDPSSPNQQQSAQEEKALVPLPSTAKRPIYRAETTGSYWGDVKAAVSRLSADDFGHIGEMPCARGSLLSGIAAGAGVGAVRGLSAGAFVASNWAVGTFVLISVGTWTICQRNRNEERRRIQQVIEEMPRRYVKKEGEGGGQGSA
ncbi:hypothetical protein GLOTRDRAFT_133393 [Gloeophyllum trabeum ATCC 11539]|uniref:Cytochrome c oxidase assembly protein COX20, mitochondrial n=1 Tax=Gloeophyllum trabeum (strain ATCC 11539 / FP-39264 / Madison 617) TaxID=670483 RepID=S7PTI2_GLOTA|nr:uncharacterized protein GLOTRDRAFT_133393 [Gloeophyllum trabeum ATCC 11539]EPQ51066.1 hypothetical protein GLOTRDRAFT_133393 [Gloeophyllum trabeum ATCC 11539]